MAKHAGPRRGHWVAAVLCLALVSLAVAALLRHLSRDVADGTQSPRADAQDVRPKAKAPRTVDSAGTLVGVTSDATGQPLEGALLCVSRRGGGAPTCSRSNGVGETRLEDLPPGDYSVTAWAAGRLPWAPTKASRRVLVEAGRTTRIVVSLTAGGRMIHGVVRDLTGGVVEDAVIAVDTPGSQETELAEVVAVAESDTEGRFSVWIDDDPWAVLRVSAVGYASAVITTPRRAVHPLYVVTLEPESSISGRVVSVSDGQPVAGARVAALANSRAPRDVAMTDDDGRFSIRGLPAGRYRPDAVADGMRGNADHSIVVGLGEDIDDVTIVVHPTPAVIVELLTADATDCDGAAVVAVRNGRDVTPASAAADRGSARFPTLLPGRYSIEVECPGHRQTEPAAVLVTRPIPYTVQVKLAQEYACEVAGHITTETGDPVARASVLVAQVSRADGVPPLGRPAPRISHPDDLGTFRIEDLSAGTYSLEVRADQFAPLPAPVEFSVPPCGEHPDINLKLSPGSTIEVRVADTSGARIAGADVVATGSGSRIAKTDDEGVVLFDRLPVGEYDVSVLPPGIGGRAMPGSVDPDSRTTVTSSSTGIVVADMIVPRRDGRITGTVSNEDGSPAPDIEIRVESLEPFISATGQRKTRVVALGRTDTDSEFEIGGLMPTERYRIVATTVGGLRAESEASAGTRLSLTLPAASTLGGVVTSSMELLSFEISVTQTDGPMHIEEAFVGTEGKWTFDGMPPGSYHVRASAAGSTAEAAISISAGDSRRDIDLVLEPTGGISGAVSGPKPLPTEIVAYQDGRRVGAARLTREGRFELLDLPAGGIELRYRMRGVAQQLPLATMDVLGGELIDIGSIPLPSASSP